ncbi:MAG: GNAT family N-acetyltransferase [Betaproteobacteria bacterium]|nr:GNAT family N-acetyltransferase [Betaproteobacteria bacterium]
MEGHPDRQDQVLSAHSVPSDLTESFEPIVGHAVTLRPLRREDHDVEHAFVSALSPDSRHNRLLGGAIRITREYIDSLITIDYTRDMALAASVMLEGHETLIGVARYVGAPDGSCEFALVIADAWQGRGIGRRMLEKLVAVARGRGLKRIYGDVLSTNRAMLELSGRLGFTRGRNPDDATVTRVTLDLA